MNQRKKDLLENAGSLFEGKRGSKKVNVHRDPDWLYAKIGQLSTELDWLKNVWAQSVVERRKWINPSEVLAPYPHNSGFLG